MQLNNIVNAISTEAHTSTQHVGTTPLGYGILLFIQGNPITGKYGKVIHHTTTSPDIGNYFKKKHEWPDAELKTIECDAFGEAQTRFTTLQQCNIHKFVQDCVGIVIKID